MPTMFWLISFLTRKKTGTTAILDGCKLDLKCEPDLMDFRFKFDDLIGSENNVDHTTGGCPAKSTDGLTDIPTVQDTNFMWRYELGFCDSEVKRTTDEARVLEFRTANFCLE